MNAITKILHWFYRLSWKKLLAASGLLLIMAAVPLSLQVATNPTRTQSEAALIPKPQPVTTEFETPKGPPQIYLVDHFFGKIGDAVLIHGENLGGLHPESEVRLAGQKITEDDLVSWTGSYIEFKVPVGAKSGKVEVSILGKRTGWPGVFFVVDPTTQAEVSLRKNPDNPKVAELIGLELDEANKLLVWLLVINSEAELKLSPAKGVNLAVNNFNLAVGKVYELKMQWLPAGEVNLVSVEKTEEQTIGIARAELSTADGQLIPVKVNPLYVSF